MKLTSVRLTSLTHIITTLPFNPSIMVRLCVREVHVVAIISDLLVKLKQDTRVLVQNMTRMCSEGYGSWVCLCVCCTTSHLSSHKPLYACTNSHCLTCTRSSRNLDIYKITAFKQGTLILLSACQACNSCWWP